jgi:hypothetical protein
MAEDYNLLAFPRFAKLFAFFNKKYPGSSVTKEDSSCSPGRMLLRQNDKVCRYGRIKCELPPAL